MLNETLEALGSSSGSHSGSLQSCSTLWIMTFDPPWVILWASLRRRGAGLQGAGTRVADRGAVASRHYPDDHRSRNLRFSQRSRARVGEILRNVVKPVQTAIGPPFHELTWPGLCAVGRHLRAGGRANPDRKKAPRAGEVELLPLS
jgi:hypothetical protein